MTLPPIPKNITIINEKYHKLQHHNWQPNTLYVWPDGSIKQGIGGFGVFIEIHTTTSTNSYASTKMLSWNLALGTQYDINYVEGKGIENAVTELANNYKQLLRKYQTIHIITDNKNMFNWIAHKQNVNESYIFKLIHQIYKYIINIQIFNVQFKLQWCERGIWFGNNEADKLAKNAVDEYLLCDQKQYTESITKISTNVLKTHLKNEWKKRKRKNIQKQEKVTVISRNMETWKIYDEAQPIWFDMRQYTVHNYGLLTQLRTEHIRLNWYFHARKHHKGYKTQILLHKCIKNIIKCDEKCCLTNNKGQCNVCETPETVYHFIIKCRKYNQIRSIHLHPIYKLMKNNKYPLTLKTLLFPPINMKWLHRKMILDSVLAFVNMTKRIPFR